MLGSVDLKEMSNIKFIYILYSKGCLSNFDIWGIIHIFCKFFGVFKISGGQQILALR